MSVFDFNISIILNNAMNKGITLTAEEKAVVTAMIRNSPETCDKIDAAIKEIMRDGKITLHDIPQIIVLISEIYKKYINFSNINIINIVHFTIDSILDSGILPFPDFEIELAKKLVDASITLLQFSFDEIEEFVDAVCCPPFCCGRPNKCRRK